MKFNPIISTSFLVLLAACGGNSASSVSNEDAVIVSSPKSLVQIEARGSKLTDDYGTMIDAGDFTTSAQLPSSGRAGMNGIVALSEVEDGDALAIGQIDVSVDFGSKQVDGIASSFRTTQDGKKITGTLTLDANITSGATPGFSGTLVGDLTQNDLVSVDLDVDGNFLGSNAQGIYGAGEGTFESEGQTGDAFVRFAAD